MILLVLIGVLMLLFVLLPFFLSVNGTKDEGGMTLYASLAVYAGAIGIAVHVREKADKNRPSVRLALTLLGRKLFTFSPPRRRAKRTKTVRAKREKSVELEKEAKAEEQGNRELRELWSPVRRGKELFQRFREPAFCFLKSFLRAFRVRSICGDLTFGTGDPAETGMVFGGLMALREILGPRFRLDARPDFVRERIEGRLVLKVLIRPYRVLGALLVLGGTLLWDELRRRIASWRAKRKGAWRAVQA